MNRKLLYCLTAAAALIMFTESSYSIDIYNMADQSSYRCRGGIVAIGDLDRTVLDKCGEPIEVASISGGYNEVYIYSFGRSKFMYYFAFLHGKLQRIVGVRCSVDDPACFDLR